MLIFFEVTERVSDSFGLWLRRLSQRLGMAFHVYILACNSNTAIYIGVASNLAQRCAQHRTGAGSIHTTKYRIKKLVYFETYETLSEACHRERQLKRWRRAWKNELIQQNNPHGSDLATEVSFL
jgi:putative endonuclease